MLNLNILKKKKYLQNIHKRTILYLSQKSLNKMPDVKKTINIKIESNVNLIL